MRSLPLIALLASLASAAPEATTPPAPLAPAGEAIAKAAEAPLSTAERNYVLEKLARDLESTKKTQHSPESQNSLDLLFVERSLYAAEVAMEGLSKEQRDFFNKERKYLEHVAQLMRTEAPAKHENIFITMLQEQRRLRETASPEIERLFFNSHAFQALKDEINMDERMYYITGLKTRALRKIQLKPRKKLTKEQEAKLTQELIDDLRSLKR